MKTNNQITSAYNNRLLVVGGGGARGAWGAGYAQYLTQKYGPYKVAFGTSTGSLMIPLIILNDFTTLKSAYTNVTQKSIFNVNPFNEKTGELKIGNLLWRIIKGKQTLGESDHLRNTIKQFLTPDLFNKIQTSPEHLAFTVTVVDFKTGIAEYKSSEHIKDYEEMVNWMWASGNEPLFMSYYNKDDHAYVDGGVLENVPLKIGLEYAINYQYSEIDVIINKPIDPLIDKDFPNRGFLKGLTRLIELFTLEIRNDDLLIPELQKAVRSNQLVTQASDPSIRVNLHYFPKTAFNGLYVKELLFNQERMKTLWELGEMGKEDSTGEFKLARQIPLDIPISTLRTLLKV